jgi:hypothetical protein
MIGSDAFLSELKALNHDWRVAKNESIKSDFPINKMISSQKVTDVPIIHTPSVSRYSFWNESQMEIDESIRESGEIKHQPSIPWSEMTKEQRLMKRKEWQVDDDFYYQRLPVDPIRIALIDDWRNMKSGAEIWWPR